MVKRLPWLMPLAIVLAACTSNPSHAPTVVNHGLTAPLEVPPYHVVAAGDTLWSISLRYDRDYRELARINHLPDDYRIMVGQHVLLDPPPVAKAPATPKPKPHPKVVKTTPPPAPLPSASGPPVITVAPADDSAAISAVSLAPVKPPISVAAPESSASTVSSQDTPVVVPVKKPAPPVGNLSKPAPPAATTEGGLAWGWPATGPILTRFSDGALGNKGLDIGGRRGDAVLAAGDGSVVYVGTGLVGYGKLIIIRHNNNYLSAYAHNDRFMVKEGEHVKLGQEIAEMGSSGADRNGLHFEIRRQGKPVDPLQYLPSH